MHIIGGMVRKPRSLTPVSLRENVKQRYQLVDPHAMTHARCSVKDGMESLVWRKSDQTLSVSKSGSGMLSTRKFPPIAEIIL